MEPIPTHPRFTELYTEAASKGHWIFNTKDKLWYTPDHFRMVCTRMGDLDLFLAPMRVMNPIEGLSAGYKKLEDLRKRLELFSVSIAKYYQERSGI